MANLVSIVSLICGVIPVLSLVSGLEFVLDVESEKDGIWRIDGNSLYAQSGKVLHQASISKFLPDNFKFPHFDLTRGIWAIFPDAKDCAVFGNKAGGANSDEWAWANSSEENQGHNDVDDVHHKDDHQHHGNGTTTRATTTTKPTTPPCDISNFASFKCSLHSQLLSSVQVWYNFGGNATIRVTGGGRQHPFEVRANNMPTAQNWVHFDLDSLSGHELLVEAIVNGTGDYILIDRIIVKTFETTTTHRPTQRPTTRPFTTSKPTDLPTEASTTSKPTENPQPTHEPSPASGNTIAATSFLTILVIMKELIV